jgi:hypothetical protein
LALKAAPADLRFPCHVRIELQRPFAHDVADVADEVELPFLLPDALFDPPPHAASDTTRTRTRGVATAARRACGAMQRLSTSGGPPASPEEDERSLSFVPIG